MSITDATTASILVKSARHCCICRRFSPLQIQIHHIIEKSDGGSDEEENLIPICIVCHSSVHTKSQMTKNFSSAELKGHRDQVYDMVAKGKLPVQPQITGSEIHEISAAIIKTLNNDGNAKKLSDQAIEILLASACEQSEIKILRSEHAFTIKTGLQEFHLRTSDSKQYPEEILELAQKGYINLNEDAATLTESGIAHTQELVKVTARFIEKKIKCLKCNIHFIICSWLAENHRANKLHCPECGQSEGAFLVWAQYKFGHIFQAVPGNATLWDYGHLPKRPK